jgi:hypothetical protein
MVRKTAGTEWCKVELVHKTEAEHQELEVS